MKPFAGEFIRRFVSGDLQETFFWRPAGKLYGKFFAGEFVEDLREEFAGRHAWAIWGRPLLENLEKNGEFCGRLSG